MYLSEAPCCTGRCGHSGFDRERNKRNVRWCSAFSGGGESNSDDLFLRACTSIVMLLPDEKPERVFDFSASDVLVGSWFRCKVKNCV